MTVASTHLRAHEPVLDLVCRPLLEKKKQLLSHGHIYYVQCPLLISYHHISSSLIIMVLPTSQLLQIQRLQQQRMQQARSQQPTLFGFSPQQQPIQLPLNVDFNSMLEQAVLAIQREYTPDNSNNIYNNKMKEYFQFWDCCYARDNYNKVLEANKLYRFMFFQPFRNQKKRGGKARD